jgi:hypothetical protein
MSLLDDLQDDPSPLVITINLDDYKKGAKFSTLVRQFFADSNSADINDYVADILLRQLKEEVVEREEKKKNKANSDAVALLEQRQAELQSDINTKLAEAELALQKARDTRLVKK